MKVVIRTALLLMVFLLVLTGCSVSDGETEPDTDDTFAIDETTDETEPQPAPK